ncbi:MAG TPA: DUF928 domain-containing protein [Oscillatoriales cyanobacterium M59_W2019_021]|nr:MAG: DUF928 domain-containing protein [Cyanobacteria bacterium J055]HIK33346.1 DUF928 domain-containing protein [Oscillatoriales cyanobacterium M4454_W2019_049]HIK52406.1 DUF928 domain-containing protein [Oscillatoriales cyanobacterium M59_W2019_021]
MRSAHLKLSQTLLSATLTGTVAIASGFYQSARAAIGDRHPPNPSISALRFESPDDSAPQSSIGGGVRGSIQFAAPDDSAAPRSSIGGGVRGDVQFSAPGESAPRSSIGGGVRGDVRFSVPDDAAPRNSESGGIRGEVEFQLPDDAAPRNSQSGGVRGNETPLLTALLPTTQTGRTISARPTFYVYVPPTASDQAFFSLQDEEGNAVYHTTLEISGEGGTIAISLPEDAPELEIGKNYLWMFAPMNPDGILRPDNYNVIGWVKRVESTFDEARMVSLSPIERATEYAKAGIWYDTLEVLVSAQLDQPQHSTLASEWKDLLAQVGLEQVATEPIER